VPQFSFSGTTVVSGPCATGKRLGRIMAGDSMIVTNVIYPHDIFALVCAAFALACGFAYELFGMTIPGWHTISYTAHRNLLVRGSILGSILALFFILAIHFAQPIAR
jgi:hypothetical protein